MRNYLQIMSDKGLISKIYKKLPQLNSKKNKNNLIKKWTNDFNIKHLSKEDMYS